MQHGNFKVVVEANGAGVSDPGCPRLNEVDLDGLRKPGSIVDSGKNEGVNAMCTGIAINVMRGDVTCLKVLSSLGCLLLIVQMGRNPFDGDVLVVRVTGCFKKVVDDFP